MRTILVSSGLIPTTKDTLLDVRTRVATFSEIANIENPARFMVITVEDTGKKYEVRKLSSKIIGGIVVENSTIDINDPEALVDLGLAEELRSEEEKVRQSNEKKRIEAENLRKAAEDSRKVNETNRVSAEDVREASERTRVSSEETRNANEHTRNSNETKRQSQEIARQDNETYRVHSENDRNASEERRNKSEMERVNRENTRSMAESQRITNENNRKSSEDLRINSEFQRGENERQRGLSETSRNNAEIERMASEVQRKKDEEARASTFETLKGQMQTTIQEGQTAVAATEKATSDAQKVVDEYDEKVAEQDSKLSELGSKMLRLNISQLFPTEGVDENGSNGGNRYDFNKAIAKVPSSKRVVGVIIDFINLKGVLNTYQLISKDSTRYYDPRSWHPFGNSLITYYADTLDLNLDISHLFSSGGYIANNGSFLYLGTYYNIQYLPVSNWEFLFIRVRKGDKFTLIGLQGGSSEALAYNIFDIAGVSIKKAGNSIVNEVLDVTEDGYIIFNRTNKNGTVIANRFSVYNDNSHTILNGLIHSASKNSKDITDITKKIEPLEGLTASVENLESMYEIQGNFYTGENVEGYMLSSGGFGGVASSLANAHSSVMLPVVGGKVYYLSGRPENSAVCCYDKDGEKMKPLAAINSAERSDFYLPSIDGSKMVNNGQFRMPDNAVSFRFGITLYQQYTEEKNKIVLELVGDEYNPDFVPTPFNGYGTNLVLKKEHLPVDNNGNNHFSIKDCPLLVVSAASHGEGFGSIQDKAFISYFSSLVDYNVENYSLSGSNSFNHFNMLMKDSSIGGVKPSDLGKRGGYVIIAHGGDNEGGYFRNGVDGKYYEMNLIRECKAWESLGFKPILSGYWGEQTAPWATMVQSVAKKYGYKYININASNYRFYPNIYSPWWYNAHFGTRTCAMQWYSLLEVLNWMPKPKQSIKIFRPRLVGQSLDNLLFDNEYERLEKWVELSLHHQSLQAGKENYVDRLDLYKNNVGNLTSVNSEYATLRNGGSVSISEKALVKIVLPKTNVSELTIKPIVNGDIRLYARQYRNSSLVIDSGIPSALYTLQSAEGIVEGDVLTDSNNSGVSFTVVDINTNTITCTASAEFATEGNMTGTLTGSNGTYNYTHLGKGPGSNYFSEIVKPIGKWIEISKNEDVYSIANPSDYIDYDSIDLCLVGSNFSISDIEVVYDGGIDKNVDNTFDKHCLNEDKFVGENILTISNFNNAATDWNVSGNYTLWDGVTSLGNHIPTYYSTKKGVTSILRLNKGAKVSQSVEMKGNTDCKVKTYKVKIAARYYPEEYSDINSKPTNGITSNSYDIGKLGITVKIGNNAVNSYYTDTLYIPATFCEIEKEYTFDFYLSTAQEQKITFEALTDRIELLYCEVFE